MKDSSDYSENISGIIILLFIIFIGCAIFGVI